MEHEAYSNQLAEPSWDVVNPSFGRAKEGSSGSQGVQNIQGGGRSCRPVGPKARRAAATCRHGNSGFFILLRWLIGFFLPQHIRGFLPVNLQVSPMYGVVCVGRIGSVSDVK